MSAADDDAQMATLDEEHAEKRASGLVGLLEGFGCLFFLHCWMTVNVGVLLGKEIALTYAIVPPVLILILPIGLSGFKPLLLPSVLVYLFMLLGTIRLMRRIRRRNPGSLTPVQRGLLLPVFVLWMPAISGEVAAALAVRYALSNSQPQCHETRSFIASMHDSAGDFRPRPPHAWTIKDGQRYLWSYRTMAFEPDPRPLAWGPVCRP